MIRFRHMGSLPEMFTSVAVFGGDVVLMRFPSRYSIGGFRAVVRTSFTGGTDVTLKLTDGTNDLTRSVVLQTADLAGVVRGASGIKTTQALRGTALTADFTENGAVTAGDIDILVDIINRENGQIFEGMLTD